ncbi:NAD(P)/FAD-dependent oxidoreductase [Synechococcus sp. PCC 7336]|uniref:NAD(P)/FAD-dependent oxidoreductase n=1 Tax=Synechococcus sp. PCC 7336 TaxID=195250 RepID=UPI00034C65AA|nr:FAD-dependent oxidoreductase [Synechococcus sp. PCC 7336]
MYDTIAIGAGLSGLICARRLVRAGLNVLVLEKSRGVGGRMDTRRVETPFGTATIDRGAQYMTASNDRFRRFVREQIELGTMAEWTRDIYELKPTGLHPAQLDNRYPRYCCPMGMTAIAKNLCESVTVQRETRIQSLRVTSEGWQAIATDDRVYRAASVAIAMPAPQILALLADWLDDSSPLYAPLQSAEYMPCIAAIAGYDPEVVLPDWQGVKWVDDERVTWLAIDSSKRIEPPQPTIAIHSTAEFAQEYWDADEGGLQSAGRYLLERAGDRLEPWLTSPQWMQVHRWRYSLPVETVGLASLATRVAAEGSNRRWPLVCAGDWCAGPTVEGAFISGEDAGARLVAMLQEIAV